MITTQNLPLEGKIKIDIQNSSWLTDFVLKRNNGSESIRLKEINFATSWAQKTSSFGTSRIRNIAYGNELLIAVGFDGKLATSSDGINWTQQTSSFGTNTIYGVAYGNGLWVAVGTSGKLATSTNGVSWTQQTSSFGGSSAIRNVAYGSGLWVAVGENGKIATSTNGTSWTQQTSGFGTSILLGIAYGNGLWVAVGESGKLATSSNGTSWTFQTSSFGTTAIFNVAYGNGLWMAVGGSGKLATSTNGISWTQQTSGFGASLIYSVVYGNGLWGIVGDGGKIAYSNNGTNWVLVTSSFDTSAIYGIAYGNNVWVAVGENGKLATLRQSSLSLYDLTAQNDITYTYSLEEKNATIPAETSQVLSTFCDAFVCSSTNSYPITYNLSYGSTERVQKSGFYEPLGRRTPEIITNGLLNYQIGNITFHLNSAGSNNFSPATEIAYRKEFLAFISDNKAKIIKDFNGNIWLVGLYGDKSMSFYKELGNGVCDISFNYAQIGKANSETDLIKAGMLNNKIINVA